MAENSARLSEEDITQFTEILKQRFLAQYSDKIDQQDLEKIQNDPLYVVRFIRHNKGNLDNAFNHMVESHKWRKSFGINAIQWDDLDDELWESGMAWNRGLDKDENNVLILNIYMHKKDAKKALMLQKWIAYCFEIQRKVYPHNKLCMIFDMSGAGLAQMDMDLVRFIINCFKIYYPDLLAWLLVYNMPWVLQAAWKIIQTWLSEGAVSKVKFVTKETLQEYIPPDQLLAKFGGTDTWEYDFVVEKERMRNLALSVSGVTAKIEVDDSNELFPEDTLEDSSQDEQPVREGGRQVRFSAGLPPTRQSRFGHDDEAIETRSTSPQQQLLQAGSVTSRGFRRRQVSRLMSLQDTTDHHSKSLMEEDKEESSAVTSSLPSLRRSLVDTSSAGSVAIIGDVMLSPATELTFIGKKDSEVTCFLTLTNTSDGTVLYKIKTTAPTRYKVRPNLALVDGKSVAKVQVVFTPGSSKTSVSQDKFLVQTYTFSPGASLPDMEKLVDFWKSLDNSSVKDHRMRCRWLPDSVPKPVLKETSSVAKYTAQPSPQASPGNLKLKSLELKVVSLAASNAELEKKLSRVLNLNYFIIIILFVLLLNVMF